MRPQNSLNARSLHHPRTTGFVRAAGLGLLALMAGAAATAKPENWTATIEKFEQLDREHAPAPNGIVFVGSSSIVKWTSLAADFPGEKVLNRGFGGSELADSVFYADRIVIPYHPRIVVIYAGENDLAAGKTPETVFADFKAFVAKLHAALPATRIVFIGFKPSLSRTAVHRELQQANRLIAAECARDERLAFVDVWPAMLNAQGEPRRELFQADRLHMTPAGYAVWQPLVAAKLK